MSTVINIPAQDQLPYSKYDPILISSVYVSSSTGIANDGGNVLDSNENTAWRTKGKDEYLYIELPERYNIKRMDIEWDPTQPRTGSFDVIFIYDTATQDNPDPPREIVGGNKDGMSMFTLIENSEGFECQYIKIEFKSEQDQNIGIANVKLWGPLDKES